MYINSGLGNAADAAHLLGLGVERPGGTTDTWDLELRRRRFWACYLMHSEAPESLAEPEPGGNKLKLTLPWPEEDFDTGVSSCHSVCLESGQSNGAIYCELIKAVRLW